MTDERSGCRRIAEMVLVGVVLLAIFGSLVAYSAKVRVPADALITWVGFIATTVLVCGYTVREHPERRTKLRFWILLVLFGVSQTVVGASVLATGVRVRAVVWPAVFFAELLALSVVLEWAVSPARAASEDESSSDDDVAANA